MEHGNIAKAIQMETPETKAMAEFNVTEAAIAEIEEYQKLEIADSKDETNVRKCRQVVRTMRTDIEKRRKEIKAPLLAHGKLIDQTAKALTARLMPTEQNLDEKIKAREAIAEAAKAERLAAEKTRLDVIRAKMADLRVKAEAGLSADLSSSEILACLDVLRPIEIPTAEYEEFHVEASMIVQDGIIRTEQSLATRIKIEDQQKAQAELEAKNKAEADRLAKIAKDQKEAMKKAIAEKKKADAEAKAKREAEAAIIAQERKALEDEKVRIKAEADRKAKEEAERIASLEKREQIAAWTEYAAALESVWMNEAYAFNTTVNNERKKAAEMAQFIYLKKWDKAIKHNAQIDLGQAMSDDIEAARIEALRPDREKLIAFAKMIGEIKLPDLQTEEGNEIAQIANALLRNCVDEIMAGVEAL